MQSLSLNLELMGERAGALLCLSLCLCLPNPWITIAAFHIGSGNPNSYVTMPAFSMENFTWVLTLSQRGVYQWCISSAPRSNSWLTFLLPNSQRQPDMCRFCFMNKTLKKGKNEKEKKLSFFSLEVLIASIFINKDKHTLYYFRNCINSLLSLKLTCYGPVESWNRPPSGKTDFCWHWRVWAAPDIF